MLIADYKRLVSCFLAEMLGTMCFQFVGSVVGTPWANGIVLTNVVYFFSKVSGAHVNPIVSLTFLAMRYITTIEFFLYVVAQFIGAIIGSLWTVLLIPGNSIWGGDVYGSGCVVPAEALSNAQIFAWELCCTSMFVAPIMAVVWYTMHKSGYGNTGPIMIGLSLTVQAFLASGFTGGSLNPARLLASLVVYNCSQANHYGFYVLGQVCGALTVPLVCMLPWYLPDPSSPKPASGRLPPASAQASASMQHV